MPPKRTEIDPHLQVRKDVFALAQQRDRTLPATAVPDIAVVAASVKESPLVDNAAPTPPLIAFDCLLEAPHFTGANHKPPGHTKPAIPREIQLMREAKKRLEVYTEALSSLQSMQTILQAYDPSLSLVPAPSGGNKANDADASQAEDDFLVKQLLAKTLRAKKRRARLRASGHGGAHHGADVACESAAGSVVGSDGEASDMDESSQLVNREFQETSHSPSNVGSAAASSEDDEDSELCKGSRWDRDVGDGGARGDAQAQNHTAAPSSNRDVIAAERKLIEETIEARAEELTAIAHLLDEFREDQEARSHELDVMQSERLNELRGLGSLIGDLASRRDAETLVYDLELRMRMADLPLVLKRPPKETADKSVGVSEEALMVARTVQFIARAGAPRLPIAPAGGGTTEPPTPILTWPSNVVAPFRVKIASQQLVPQRVRGGGRSRLGGEGATKPGTSVPDEFLCFVSGRFGEPALMERIWQQDPVGYAAATAQCLNALVVAATKWRVYISHASRETFLIAAANPTDALECFLMLDDQLTNHCRWEAAIKNHHDMALVADTHSDVLATRSLSPTLQGSTQGSSHAAPPLLFQGPRLAGFMWMGQVSMHHKGARIRCEYNPSSLRHEFVGPDVAMMGAVLRHLVRGGELLTTRDVWRLVLHCSPRRFSGFLLCETAYRISGGVDTDAGDGGRALHHALAGTPLLSGTAEGGAGASHPLGPYAKLMAVMPFELRNRATVLGLHPRHMGQRQFVQASFAVPCGLDDRPPVVGTGGATASASAHSGVFIPGDDQPDSEWLHLQPEALADSSVDNMFAIALPEAMHVLPFRRPSDSSWNGVAVVMVPHLRALVSTLPNGPACVQHFFALMWLAAMRASCSFHGGGRIHLNHLVHPGIAQRPQFKDCVTTDPAEAKAMLVACSLNSMVWLFREPLMATTFAMLLQNDLVQATWEEDLCAFYNNTLPMWMDRNGHSGGSGEHNETTAGGNNSTNKATTISPVPRQRSFVGIATISPTYGMGGSSGGGGSSSGRGLRVSIGVASGVPTIQTHPQTQLFEYTGVVMEYAQQLALHARPGEVLISPRERERLLDSTGTSIELPVVGRFYHVISVSPLRTPDRLKVFAAIPSQLRDRQALIGELPTASLEQLNAAYLAVQQSSDAVDRRGSFYSIATRQSNAQQERARETMLHAAKVLLLGAGGATATNSGSVVARHKANMSVYDNVVLHIESNQVPPNVMDSFAKMLEAGVQHQLVHRSVVGQSRGGSLVGSPLAPHSPGTSGGGGARRDTKAAASPSFATEHRNSSAVPAVMAMNVVSESSTPVLPQPHPPSTSGSPRVESRTASFERARTVSVEVVPETTDACDTRLPPLPGHRVHDAVGGTSPPPSIATPPAAAAVALPPIAPIAAVRSSGRAQRTDANGGVVPLTIDIDASHRANSRSPQANARSAPATAASTSPLTATNAKQGGTATVARSSTMSPRQSPAAGDATRGDGRINGGAEAQTSWEATAAISPSASLSPQASLAQPVALTSLSSGHRSPTPVEELVSPSSGSSSLPAATVPLGLFVELSSALATLKTERDALRRELEQANHALKMNKRKAMNAAAAAATAVVRAPNALQSDGDDSAAFDRDSDADDEAGHGPESVAVQTSPWLLDRSGSTTSWVPRVSVETSLIGGMDNSAAAAASARSSTTSMDPTLFPSISDAVSDSSSSLMASTTSPVAAGGIKRKKSHRRSRRHVRDSIVRGVMDMVNSNGATGTSPPPSPHRVRGGGRQAGRVEGEHDVPEVPTSTSHSPKHTEARDGDPEARIGEDPDGVFSGTIHRLMSTATAVVPWEAQPTPSDAPSRHPPSPVGVMTAQSSSTMPVVPTVDADTRQKRKTSQPTAVARVAPPPFASQIPSPQKLSHGNTTQAPPPVAPLSPHRTVMPPAGPNSFTNFCEEQIFAPMREEEHARRMLLATGPLSPVSVPLHTGAPGRGAQDDVTAAVSDRLRINSTAVAVPTQGATTAPAEAPRRGTDAYNEWLAQLNAHVQTHAKAQQRIMR